MNHSIYVLIFPSGKKYVGYTSRTDRRFREHRSHARKNSQLPVHAAIRKYGWDSIVIEIENFIDREVALAEEARRIREMNTLCPNGYNVSLGGDCSPVMSPVMRDAITEKLRRAWDRPEYRRRVTEAAKAYRPTEDQRRKNAEAKKRNWSDPEYRAKLSAAHSGKKQPPETLERRSRSLKAAWAKGHGADARRKAMTGRTWFNNGVEHRQFVPGELPPEGWTRGMLKRVG